MWQKSGQGSFECSIVFERQLCICEMASKAKQQRQKLIIIHLDIVVSMLIRTKLTRKRTKLGMMVICSTTCTYCLKFTIILYNYVQFVRFTLIL